jgi:DNA-binding NarL/FixJ family response regulator
MITQKIRFSVLVLNEEVRSIILNMLKKNENFSFEIVSLDLLVASEKTEPNSIVLIDSEGVLAFGPTVISRIRSSRPDSKLILLCSRNHRGLIEPCMELGAYGCIIEPYKEWEFATMVRLITSGRGIQAKTKPKDGKRGGENSREK